MDHAYSPRYSDCIITDSDSNNSQTAGRKLHFPAKLQAVEHVWQGRGFSAKMDETRSNEVAEKWPKTATISMGKVFERQELIIICNLLHFNINVQFATSNTMSFLYSSYIYPSVLVWRSIVSKYDPMHSNVERFSALLITVPDGCVEKYATTAPFTVKCSRLLPSWPYSELSAWFWLEPTCSRFPVQRIPPLLYSQYEAEPLPWKLFRGDPIIFDASCFLLFTLFICSSFIDDDSNNDDEIGKVCPIGVLESLVLLSIDTIQFKIFAVSIVLIYRVRAWVADM